MHKHFISPHDEDDVDVDDVDGDDDDDDNIDDVDDDVDEENHLSQWSAHHLSQVPAENFKIYDFHF